MCFKICMKIYGYIKLVWVLKNFESFLNISKRFNDIKMKLLYYKNIESLLYIKPKINVF